MTDETVSAIQEDNQPVDNKPSYEDLESRLNAVLAKHDQLLDEAKKTKNKAREESEKARQQQEDAKQSAAKNGEYEKLWKTEQEEKSGLLDELNKIKNGYRKEKIEIQAMRLANDLADGDNAELLSEFIVRQIDSMSDEMGALGADVLDSIKLEFKNNAKYKALLRSSKASGGGAVGNMKGAQQILNLTRDEFARLNPVQQSEFASKIRSGQATLTDN